MHQNKTIRLAFWVVALTIGCVATNPNIAGAEDDGKKNVAGKNVVNERAASMQAAADRIDDFVRAVWKRDHIQPAERSDDAEFCRRVWLDLAGIAPPIHEIRSFLSDEDPGKRSKLIDRLVASPHHASHMAATWNDILLPADTNTQRQRENVLALENWLRDQFLANTPYDYFVASFLTAGGTGNRGPAVFYTTREVEPKKVAAATSKIFLGIQLQCAECHDHPFDRWTQKDFWSYAAFFAQIERSNQRMNEGGFILDRPDGEVTLPETDEVVPPRYPGIEEPPEQDVTNNRRRQLTIWMASRDNQYFVKAAANRAWAHLFGRGLVDPVDAMDQNNPPSHPELLEFLAQYLVENRFDMRRLFATLARTETYHLTSAYSGERPEDKTFAAMNIKTLTPRQYYDSIQANVFRRLTNNQGQMGDPSREQFLSRMRGATHSPRDYPHGVMQALGLMNGPEMAQATHSRSGGLLMAIGAPFFEQSDRIDALFLATVSRLPDASERTRIESFLKSGNTKLGETELLSDVLWSLLSTAEATVCP